MNGGEGVDTADFTTAGTSLRVDLASGEAHGRGDDVLAENENASTGIGNDVLRGTAQANTLFSRDRHRDRINGGPGRDWATANRFDRRRSVERLKLPRR